jgi:DNA-binding transcriptional ArsR family regulator
MSSVLNSTVESVLDVLLDHPNVGYSKKDLAEAAGISRSALYDNWSILEENKLVVEKKKYGGTTLYRLNPDSEIVNYLGRIIDEQANLEQKKAVV